MVDDTSRSDTRRSMRRLPIIQVSVPQCATGYLLFDSIREARLKVIHFGTRQLKV
jgi:hypothetical protein